MALITGLLSGTSVLCGIRHAVLYHKVFLLSLVPSPSDKNYPRGQRLTRLRRVCFSFVRRAFLFLSAFALAARDQKALAGPTLTAPNDLVVILSHESIGCRCKSTEIRQTLQHTVTWIHHLEHSKRFQRCVDGVRFVTQR
jgi:hypothetical protein